MELPAPMLVVVQHSDSAATITVESGQPLVSTRTSVANTEYKAKVRHRLVPVVW